MPTEYAELNAEQLLEWQARGAQVVDVREEFELLGGVIPGAVSLPLSRFLQGLDQLKEAPVVFVCAHGVRSQDAAAYVARQGYGHAVAHLVGGMAEWRVAQRQVVHP